jgi:uncharacterized protein (TIGR02391 family)
MKELDYTIENIRLLASIISKASSGSLFTKLLRDAGWTPELTAAGAWQISKKNKEDYLFDELNKILDLNRTDILNFILDKTLTKSSIYFKKNNKDYKFPQDSFKKLKEHLKISTVDTKEKLTKEFNSRSFHPKISKACKALFCDGHFSSSIFEGCKMLNNEVKNIVRSEKDGKSLMLDVFSLTSRKIKLNPLSNQSDIDEQEGFMHIYAGVMQGIRNPKAHESVNLKDKVKGLEYLSFLSLLQRRLDERK